MKLSNLKDTLTSIFGALGAIGGAILAIPATVIALPAAIVTAGGIMVAISVAGIGYLTGKNPDGSQKSAQQIDTQNSQAAPK